MKKLLFLFLILFVGTGIYAQEKNGTVYIKHPGIEKTKKLWAAFEKGDQVTYGSLLADSAVVIYNGSRDVQKKEDHLKNLSWWSTEFEGLKVKDDAPAYPDAIEYDKGGLWVQDWIVITGRHKKSGINLESHLHCLYSFNKDGAISSLHLYYDNDPFEEINNSGSTRENGKIFIDHPYIVSVRKLVNAYCDENISAMIAFYTPDATFSNSTMEWGKSIDLAARKKEIETNFTEIENIQMRQEGYPDCIYYAKNDSYVVYSWWVFSGTAKADGKKTEFPIMLAHSFNGEGKIVSEAAYYSSNHFE